MNEEEQPRRRILPLNELDFYLMTTESTWGKSEVTPGMKEYLHKVEGYYTNEKGEIVGVKKKALWDMMSFYTRDLRLANLSEMRNEVKYCHYYLDLAGDFLKDERVEPFMVCISRVATVLEISQSRGGFLRKTMNTLTTENINVETEPPKKKIFGGGLSGQQNGGFN